MQAAMSGLDSPQPELPNMANNMESPIVDLSPPNGVSPPSYMEALHSASEECVAGLRMTDPGGPFVESMQRAAARIASQIASTSSAPPTRLLNFLIEYRNRNIMLRVPDNETVGLYECCAFVFFIKLSAQEKSKFCWRVS